jgi:cell wall-associated protease
MNCNVKQWLIIVCILMANLGIYAQGTSVKTELPRGWHLLDKEQDGFYGISIQKAYDFIHEKKLTSKTVIVAVIDTGLDTLQEDLKDVIWTNPKEIPGNGIDDDHNGYVDDMHGWNFLGGKDGTNVKDDASEEIRTFYKYKKQFEDSSFNAANLKGDDLDTYKMWALAKKRLMGDGTNEIDLVMLERVLGACLKSDSILQKAMGKKEYTGNDLDKFQVTNMDTRTAKSVLLYFFKENKIMDITNTSFLNDFKEEADGEIKKADAKQNAPPDYRKLIVKDDESDINDRNYGNANVMAGDPLHGTHVSGIIAAERNNNKGIDGIADNVKIMMLRVLPNGDEHDKDIALAIRYAVDNGAKVINMSFGKHISPNKKWIDDAAKYADSKEVLLVQAAGNDFANIDSVDNFPTPVFKDGKTKATNWIMVGASSDPLAEPSFKSYVASFSNYGKAEVNVFAPGVKIYSTLPGGNVYGNESGTSMAAPVVSGVAALILEYYPSLTPEQVKYCIEKSAIALPAKVKKPGSENEEVSLSDISTSGGILNAYEAIKLAASLNKEVKKKDPLPKSTLENKKG